MARVRGAVDLKGAEAAVIGVGPVGLRTAELLRREGAEVTMFTFPPDAMEGKHRRASGIPVAEEAGFEVVEPASSDELDGGARRARGRVRRRSRGHPDPAAQRLDAGGRARGRRLLGGRSGRASRASIGATASRRRTASSSSGALAVGGPKMKLQKALHARHVRDQGHRARPRGRLRRRARGAVSARCRRYFFENTNLPIGPSSGPSASGRQRIVSSILRARVKSLSVMPPAECVASLTQSLPQVTFRSA